MPKIKSAKKKILNQFYLIFVIAVLLLLIILIPNFRAEDVRGVTMKQAHQMLTDGKKAGDEGVIHPWLEFDKDSTELPKTSYALGELSFWGMNYPMGVSPDSTGRFSALMDANIKTGRMDFNWAGIQQHVTYTFDWYDREKLTNDLTNAGGRMIGAISDVPAWANGWLPHEFPPNLPVDKDSDDNLAGELIDFTGNSTVQLAKAGTINGESRAVIDELPDYFPVVAAEVDGSNNVITSGDLINDNIASNGVTDFGKSELGVGTPSPIMFVQTATYPIVLDNSLKVEVDIDGSAAGSGFVEWTKIDNFKDVANNVPNPGQTKGEQTTYMADRQGYIRFAYNKYMSGYGKVVPNGAYIRVTYKKIQTVYNQDVDFKINPDAGTITRVGDPNFSGLINTENFSSSVLNPSWQWLGNQPPTTVVGNGELKFTPTTSQQNQIGDFLYQTVTDTTPTNTTDNDLRFSVRVGSMNDVNKNIAGIAVYQDENNWFRFGLSDDAGRIYLTQSVSHQDGSVTVETTGENSAYSFNCQIPKWITVVKEGDTWIAFASDNENNPLELGSCVSYKSRAIINKDAVGPVDPNSPSGEAPIAQTLEFSPTLKIGLSTIGLNQVSFTNTTIIPPNLPQKVRLFYSVLNATVYTDFLTTMVNHYKDRIKYWELWNEPDQGWEWKGGQIIMGILAREGSEAIKAADPEAKVIGPGIANSGGQSIAIAGYTTYADVLGLNKSLLDAVAWHPYLFSGYSPDRIGWLGQNNTAKNKLIQLGFDSHKLMLGELASVSGVNSGLETSSNRTINARTQADYGSRLLMQARQVNEIESIQWWPIVDLCVVGQCEDKVFGQHEGLFYEAGTLKPKPMYYAYKNLATNKGVLFDLGKYSGNDDQLVESTHNINKITIGVDNPNTISDIEVFTSNTNTDNAAIPDQVAGGYRSVAGAIVGEVSPLVVNVNTASAVTASWTLTALSSSTFALKMGEEAQGNATVGVPFTSSNQMVSFTIAAAPANRPYAVGEKFLFETFKGDGYTEITNISRVDSNDLITLTFDARVARYVSIRFTKSPSFDTYFIDEVEISNTQNTNVARGKYYVVDGYITATEEIIEPPDPSPDIPSPSPDISPSPSPVGPSPSPSPVIPPPSPSPSPVIPPSSPSPVIPGPSPDAPSPVSTVSIPTDKFSEGWHMITFPKIAENSFADFINGGSYDANNKIRSFNASSNKYDAFISADSNSLKPIAGKSYWIRLRAGESLNGKAYRYSDSGSFEVSVSRGWNQIGNPFDSDYDINRLKVKLKNGRVYSYTDAVKNLLIYDYMWSYERGYAKYNGYHFISKNSKYSSYSPEGSLPTWRGAWLLVRSTNVSSIIF